jgi:DNA-binding transcriptional regulator YhcF (GntR family)
MDIVVERDAAAPVYEQIADQVRSHIAAGEIAVGAELPAVRTLASDLGVNLNTVARAYRLLEDQGFVRIRDRSGVVVTAPPARPDGETAVRLGGELRGLLERLRQAGIAAEEIRRLVELELKPLGERR